jgi:hypothetical protein
MREVEVRLSGWGLAEAMAELRKWLDHHECTPADFGIVAESSALLVRITFKDDAMAERFQREFGRRS